MRTTILSQVAILTAALALCACAGHATKDTTNAPTTSASTAQASEKTQDANSALGQISCVKSPAAQSDTRVLQIEAVTPKGCRLQYTRYGHTGPVAWSYVGNSYCETVRTKIIDKLENAGYKCGDASKEKTADKAATEAGKKTAETATDSVK
jgi:hypothetical protein